MWGDGVFSGVVFGVSGLDSSSFGDVDDYFSDVFFHHFICADSAGEEVFAVFGVWWLFAPFCSLAVVVVFGVSYPIVEYAGMVYWEEDVAFVGVLSFGCSGAEVAFIGVDGGVAEVSDFFEAEAGV